jgi:DNA-binding winged helix-turn-helix (wHTH) protein
MSEAGRLRFGTFELDVESCELWRHGQKLALAPKPAKLLALLAGEAGRLVTRETIRKRLWGPDTFVDFEHALNFCVREIRTALGDDPRHPHYIQTLPRRGYRFIAEVSGAAAPPQSAAPSEESRQIEAYERYLEARRDLEQMGKGSLERAREGFERAVTLDPGYAMAHSGLGATHAMRVINRRDPDDLDKAHAHLTRAVELDPELAEPYPWLCYIHVRRSRLDLAIEAGCRGVRLLPTLVHAHYFLAIAYLTSAESGAARYQQVADHLLEATRLGPGWQPSWFVLASLALVQGDYARARGFATRLLEWNARGAGVPFIGAELVLAGTALREGRPEEGRKSLADFVVRLEASDHMYRTGMTAVAACLSGDIALRSGRTTEAMAAYRRAWQSTQEHTRMLAQQRISARAQAGIAAVYAAEGQWEQSRTLLERSVEIAGRSEESAFAAAGANLCELYWPLAVGYARLKDRPAALSMLERAVHTGWLDGAWLENDPELASLRCEPRFHALRERIARAPKATFDGAELSAAAAL